MTIDWWGTIGIVACAMSAFILGAAVFYAFSHSNISGVATLSLLGIWGAAITAILRRGDI